MTDASCSVNAPLKIFCVERKIYEYIFNFPPLSLAAISLIRDFIYKDDWLAAKIMSYQKIAAIFWTLRQCLVTFNQRKIKCHIQLAGDINYGKKCSWSFQFADKIQTTRSTKRWLDVETFLKTHVNNKCSTLESKALLVPLFHYRQVFGSFPPWYTLKFWNCSNREQWPCTIW